MTNYEVLLEEYKKYFIHEMDLDELKGLFARTGECELIIIDKKLTSSEKLCILAEEIGHALTTVGDITDQDTVSNIKQEQLGRSWGYEKILPLSRLIDAYKANCLTRDDLLEYLGVTLDFLLGALTYYKHKHGISCSIDNVYTITFEPLGIYEHF